MVKDRILENGLIETTFACPVCKNACVAKRLRERQGPICPEFYTCAKCKVTTAYFTVEGDGYKSLPFGDFKKKFSDLTENDAKRIVDNYNNTISSQSNSI